MKVFEFQYINNLSTLTLEGTKQKAAVFLVSLIIICLG